MTYKASLSMRRQLLVFAIAMIAYHVIFTFAMGVTTEPSNPHELVALTLGGPTYFVCLFALICGANLGLERSQYGRVTQLFPISRIRLAMSTLGVDIAGLIVAYIFACTLEIGAFVAVHGFQSLHGGSLLGCAIIPFASIIALYGVSALSSVVVGHGRFVGPILAVASFLALMLTAPDVPAHLTFQWMNVINPVVYLYLATVQLLGPPPVLEFYRGISLASIATILTLIAFISLLLTAFIFRRTRSTFDVS